MLSLLHAKALLLTHGYQSFYEYISAHFSETSNKKMSAFTKKFKETPEYKEFYMYLEEHRHASNHPKLRKLVEILITFFSDPEHAKSSKVIIFSQFRSSANEIKNFLDLKSEGLVKSKIFVGQSKGTGTDVGLSQKGQAALIA